MKKKVLLLNTNCDLADIDQLYEVLSKHGFQVQSSNVCALDSITPLEESIFDIIVFRITTIELYLSYRSMLQPVFDLYDKPVLFITYFNTIAEYLQALQAGIYEYINMPCTEELLIERISWIGDMQPERNVDEELCEYKCTYRGTTYNLSIPKYGLTHFIVSSLQNGNHQQEVLLEVLQTSEKNSRNMKLFTQQTIHLHNKERELEERLYDAYNNNEFKLFYQPIFSLQEDRLFGFESLIRWQHPEKGIIPPDEFMPIVENSHLVFSLGFWIIEEVCRQIGEWQRSCSNFPSLRVNINLSPKQFLHPELYDWIISTVEKYRIDPLSVGFEITESSFMEDIEQANIMLLQLKSKQFPLYMDDFGTGYSSLSYLTHFPVDILKIDKSFVKWMHVDEQSEAIVKAVIYLAHSLSMKVVCEGVESEEHYALCKEFNADYAQGYYYDKPLTPENARNFIEQHFHT